MPLDRPLTAADILNYEPAPEQKKHGSRVYASRLMAEGVRFEQAGNDLQAKLRYEKCKAYCKLRGIEFPPFSGKKTALIQAVETDPTEPKPWVQGEEVVVNRITRHGVYGEEAAIVAKRRGRPPGSKNKPAKRAWSGDREACKQKGREIWIQRLLSEGRLAEAGAFAAKHGMTISGDVHGGQGDPITGGLASVPPHATHAPDSFSDGIAAKAAEAQVSAGNINQGAVPSESQPVVEVPIEKLSLRDQLMRQIAEMDAAERKAGLPAVSDAPVPQPVVVEPDDTPKVKWDASQQTNENVKTYVVATFKVAVEPKPQEPTPVVAADPSLRKARIHNFALNPRLANIQFLDGAKEWGSMWITRVGMRLNEVVQVELERGIPGVNGIYQEPRKRT